MTILGAAAHSQMPVLSSNETLEARGLSVIVEQNKFSPIFFDEKNAGIQIILHGDRVATDGEIRLNPTPEQWDPVPTFVGRTVGAEPNQLVVRSAYPDADLHYKVKVTAEEGGFRIAVDLDEPLAKKLAGKAGFNLDFLPTAYFGKTYLMDKAPGLFPRHPVGPMAKDGTGNPLPLASGGSSITLAPEDPTMRVSITSEHAPLELYDARNRAQNGWFVVRSLIQPGAKEDAVVWHVRTSISSDWAREPVVSFNQAGYTPDRTKIALIELDPNFAAPGEAELVRLDADGSRKAVLRAEVKPWGTWMRYKYATFDFSAIREAGIYAISYAGKQTNPFRIAADAYSHVWQTSLDTFLAEQMDHVGVHEEYRVWQRPSHLDDARQAPANIVHFDGYKMGASLDSPYKAGEHIPSLNVGGWQDAGDYDIQTPDNAWVVRDLVWAREQFGLDWDETSVDENSRSVEIRKPDGVPDVLQQIRHGTLQLLAQYKAFGHAIVGIVDPVLRQYAHLGDAGSQTDGLIYDSKLGRNEIGGSHSGLPDDRWAFTTDLPVNDLFVAGALAGASRTLAATDSKLAAEALAASKIMWAKQQLRLSDGNRKDAGPFTPRVPEIANVMATVELVISTKGDAAYTSRLKQMMPTITQHLDWLGGTAVRALPYMDAESRAQMTAAVREMKIRLDTDLSKNPFGVPVSEGTWGGSYQVAAFGTNMYYLHKAFPSIIGPEYTIRALDYILGRHPANNLSLVSTVGTASKLIGYGHNRADYSFIPGGMVPGVVIIKPDYPELKTDWPFLWFENEYTVSTTSAYILMANAAVALTKEQH